MADGSYGDEMIFARLATRPGRRPDRVLRSDELGAAEEAADRSRADPGRPRPGAVVRDPVQDRTGSCPAASSSREETPRLGAVARCARSWGSSWPSAGCVVVDWLPPYLGWDDAIEMIFDGGTVAECRARRPGRCSPPRSSRVALVDLDDGGRAADAARPPSAHHRDVAWSPARWPTPRTARDSADGAQAFSELQPHIVKGDGAAAPASTQSVPLPVSPQHVADVVHRQRARLPAAVSVRLPVACRMVKSALSPCAW